MRMTSKARLCERANKIIDDFQVVTERLFTLRDQGKITGGCLMVYNWNNTYYEMLSKVVYPTSKGYKNTTESEIGVLVKLYEAERVKALAFVEEQEAATMETCQKAQVEAELAATTAVEGAEVMTFCEMHKASGGCEECPNRYVCEDSPLKTVPQKPEADAAAEAEKNKAKNFLVGYYVVKEDEVFTDNGYACAAWFKKILVKAGRYAVMAGQYSYHERDKYYMDKLADRSLSVKLPGTVVAADFQGRYFGKPIGGSDDASKKYLGETSSICLSPYAHATALAILEGTSSIELLPEFEAREIPFEYEGKPNKTYGIFRKAGV